MRRKKLPKGRTLRKKLAKYLVKRDYTMFEICLLLGYSLRDFQIQVESPFLSFEHRRLISDDEYREQRVNGLVGAMLRSQSSEGSP